jgi:C4-dicarboxylate transporter DctM subunit
MSSELIGWMGIGAMILLLLLRVPVAFVMGTVGLLGYAALSGVNPALQVAGMVPYSSIASYSFSVIPLFIIMGHFAHHAGFVSEVFRTARAWLGGSRGGLINATIAAGAAFGAACGSGLASCAILSKITIPEMRKAGVQTSLACGTAAAVGPLAQMIPPSILMVIYGIITETSVGKLLIAGILPGLLLAFGFMTMTYFRIRRNPQLAPMLDKGISWNQRFLSLKGVWGIAVLAALIIGGIYTGTFTPAEAGGCGAFGAFILGITLRKLTWERIRESLVDTARITGMVFLIIACSFIFSYFLSISRIPFNISEFLTQLPVSPLAILIGVMVFYLFLGMFIDMVAGMFITLPIIFPAMVSLGFDPIWFGVLIVMQCEIALITPPFGINLFIVRGVIEDVELMDVIRGVIPYLLVDIIVLALYVAFPQIALFLPQRMLGK